MNELEFETSQQKTSFSLLYDMVQRICFGGKDSLYDQYPNVWLTDYFFEVELEDLVERNNEGLKIENLQENIYGWDFGYLINTEYPYMDYYLVFNIEGEDVGSLTTVRTDYTSLDDGIKKHLENIIFPYKETLNNEVSMLKGEDEFESYTVDDLSQYLKEYYGSNVCTGNIVTDSWYLSDYIIPDIIDYGRQIDTTTLLSWIYDHETNQYEMIYPGNAKAVNAYDEMKIKDSVFYRIEEIPTEMFSVRVETHYFLESINYYDYSYEIITMLTNKEKWVLAYSPRFIDKMMDISVFE